VMHACILWALDDWLLRDTESDVMQRRTNWSSVERAEEWKRTRTKDKQKPRMQEKGA
jgi:hypothetical protein